MNASFTRVISGVIFLMGMAIAFVPISASAHCDTMDGPVVKDAQAALEKGDVMPVLKWVMPEYAQEIRTSFDKTVKVRLLNTEAKNLADMYFFETLVRLHRTGEGVAYTGLKPAGTPLEPGVAAADQALTSGQVDLLIKHLNTELNLGIKQRFDRVNELKQHANDNLEAGHLYVAAYIEYVHFIERLAKDATSSAAEHTEKTTEETHQD